MSINSQQSSQKSVISQSTQQNKKGLNRFNSLPKMINQKDYQNKQKNDIQKFQWKPYDESDQVVKQKNVTFNNNQQKNRNKNNLNGNFNENKYIQQKNKKQQNYFNDDLVSIQSDRSKISFYDTNKKSVLHNRAGTSIGIRNRDQYNQHYQQNQGKNVNQNLNQNQKNENDINSNNYNENNKIQQNKNNNIGNIENQSDLEEDRSIIERIVAQSSKINIPGIKYDENWKKDLLQEKNQNYFDQKQIFVADRLEQDEWTALVKYDAFLLEKEKEQNLKKKLHQQETMREILNQQIQERNQKQQEEKEEEYEFLKVEGEQINKAQDKNQNYLDEQKMKRKLQGDLLKQQIREKRRNNRNQKKIQNQEEKRLKDFLDRDTYLEKEEQVQQKMNYYKTYQQFMKEADLEKKQKEQKENQEKMEDFSYVKLVELIDRDKMKQEQKQQQDQKQKIQNLLKNQAHIDLAEKKRREKEEEDYYHQQVMLNKWHEDQKEEEKQRRLQKEAKEVESTQKNQIKFRQTFKEKEKEMDKQQAQMWNQNLRDFQEEQENQKIEEKKFLKKQQLELQEQIRLNQQRKMFDQFKGMSLQELLQNRDLLRQTKENEIQDIKLQVDTLQNFKNVYQNNKDLKNTFY
ncbi:hypothetical protein PPERSA_12200 [Pseudocohnilembus persalinus]|uniref:Uncharacterized protein n=1 Tax=Pseudocohnilembus persalinus TaxID=266149 RepID=A0A0V0R8P2_PSEPJ|nr:hypothetical protein PPERSA_12200 [Pseudocohnilembus persalinus]|eukprot:KRX10849.1 hypothetical protein PPERSA_12200 [Pseudocohnilembus persalinus]